MSAIHVIIECKQEHTTTQSAEWSAMGKKRARMHTHVPHIFASHFKWWPHPIYYRVEFRNLILFHFVVAAASKFYFLLSLSVTTIWFYFATSVVMHEFLFIIVHCSTRVQFNPIHFGFEVYVVRTHSRNVRYHLCRVITANGEFSFRSPEFESTEKVKFTKY